VLADSVSIACTEQIDSPEFFFARAAVVCEGKILYFATIIDTNRDSTHRPQNEDSFATFSLGLEFFNEAEKEKNNGKGDSAAVPSRFAALNNHLSDFRVRFDAQFHRLCYKTIGSCF